MLIGLTGGIGSGKSVISNELRKMGYAVYDSDKEAKRLILENEQVREKMIELFGKEVYRDGIYQTGLVAQQVFADSSLLAQLNAIVHPAVKEDLLRWSHAQMGLSKNQILFVECAILYQAGLDILCEKVVVVTAPEEIRLARVVARDCTDINKVRARMRAQEVEKDIEKADILINNDGNKAIPTLCEEIVQQI